MPGRRRQVMTCARACATKWQDCVSIVEIAATTAILILQKTRSLNPRACRPIEMHAQCAFTCELGMRGISGDVQVSNLCISDIVDVIPREDGARMPARLLN